MRDQPLTYKKGRLSSGSLGAEVPMPVMKRRAKKATKSKPMRKGIMKKKKAAKKTKKK